MAKWTKSGYESSSPQQFGYEKTKLNIEIKTKTLRTDRPALNKLEKSYKCGNEK